MQGIITRFTGYTNILWLSKKYSVPRNCFFKHEDIESQLRILLKTKIEIKKIQVSTEYIYNGHVEFLLYHSIFTNALSLPTSKKEPANISKHTEGMLRNLNRMWPAWREGWLTSSTYCTPTKYILYSHQIFPCQPGLMVTRIEEEVRWYPWGEADF